MNRLVLSLDFSPIIAAILNYLLMQGVIGYGENLRRQIGSVLCACLTHRDCRHWNSAWHLCGGEQGIETLKGTAINRHADDWALGVRGNGTRQVRGHASSTNKYAAAAVFRILHVGLSTRWSSVSTCHPDFKTNTQRVQH